MPLELDMIDQGVTHNLEVRAMASRFEVGVVGGHALAVAAVNRPATDPAGGAGSVGVITPRVPKAEAGLTQCLVNGTPCFHGRTVDRDGTALAVVGRLGEVVVVFQLDEVGQDLVAGPTRAALCGPEIEVFEQAADGDLAVDGRTASQPTAPPVGFGRLPFGAARHEPGILELRKPGITDDGYRVGNAHFTRSFVRAPVGTCVEQQNACSWIFAQAGRQCCPRRARTDDDVVVHVCLQQSQKRWRVASL
jgi:hypothetical protein